MRTKENPLLISFKELKPQDRWNACISALQSEYILTLRDICKILKCSRSWFNRYITPHLHYIYLSNGSGKSPNYVRTASKQLEKPMTESTWYSIKEFQVLISSSITSITRQTIRIPIELLIKEEKLEHFKNHYISLKDIEVAYDKTEDSELYKKRRQEREQLLTECLSENGKILLENYPSKYKRTDSPAMECAMQNINPNNFVAVHDLKEYGDTDEEIYRSLFERGCYKLVLKIPDVNGEISEKIYYQYADNEFDESTSMEMVLVKYQLYVSLYNNI